MAHNRRLLTDQDFKEAMDRQVAVRVFQDDHVVDSGGIITRFDEQTVVIQSSVSELGYHSRSACEFFGMRKK
ncbi:hypothetical protein [Paenibacillus rigui]|uniref:Uncharacterized protein n=1 Tax=Paenibacillus rigui TaxID=554312 RepID=A0A229UII2_9BACL|nr:hypothetical protein [Paenibacillus rigui]OXM82719.1 hypothetical protein CF651_29040 [Paenibacillus rigui]